MNSQSLITIADFDLCEACEGKRETVGVHSPSHVLLKIPVPTSVSVDASWLPRSAPHNGAALHSHIKCDGCRGAIVGIRYKCANCADYDLCASCEAADVHQETGHLFLKVRKPVHSYFPAHTPLLPMVSPGANPFRRGNGRRSGRAYTNICEDLFDEYTFLREFC